MAFKTIQLTQSKVTIVDEEDYEFLMQWKWYFHYGYAVTNISLERCPHCNYTPRKMVYIHKKIMRSTNKNQLVDHINRDKLDNRKSNLRIASISQNLTNSKRKNKKYSQYKGVTKNHQGRWKAAININGKYIELGRYENEIDAATAYNEAAKKYHGEFAYINPIEVN